MVMSAHLKVMDVNALSYLYTKLKNNIDEYQSQYTDTLDQATNMLTDTANNYATIDYVNSASVASAAKLTTARTIALTGAVTGSVAFDGSGNVSIATSVQSGTSAPSTLATGSVYYVYE
jgi:hypothetical protein